MSSEKTIEPFNWFSKESWYAESANFIIIDENQSIPQFGISNTSIIETLGVPSRQIEVENYHIYIYNHDISKILKKK